MTSKIFTEYVDDTIHHLLPLKRLQARASSNVTILSSPLTLYKNYIIICVTVTLGLYIGIYITIQYTCRIHDFCKHETLTGCLAKRRGLWANISTALG